MISFNSVNVAFDGRTVLENLSLELREQRIGIIGWNGSGKSTFSRLINGLQSPTSGSVTVAGLDTTKDGGKVRRKVGFVFQNPDNQIVYPIVKEDIAFGLKGLKLPKEERDHRIQQIFDQYQLSHLRERLTHQLSGGEKQMIALMGVLVMQPDIIILDEPTTLLDLRNKARLMETVNSLPQQILMVTHDLELLDGFDRVLMFHEGRLYQDGSPPDVIKTYREISLSC
ncbi:MAG: ABC transporter ATP-binding protein [Sneathiella sp.]|nr:ABC transporter ATP-binding protein [Sneathiella sp.]